MNPSSSAETLTTDADTGPVTVVISRRVTPGKEAEFEALSTEMTEKAAAFTGHTGTTMFRPVNSDNPEYRIIFRFDSRKNLAAWEQSEERARLLSRLEPLLSSPTRREVNEGIYLWFDLPQSSQQAPPPRYKMTIVSWMALYPIVTIIFFLFGKPLQTMPLLIRTLLVTAAVMVLMSYVAMPRMTRWFRGWLYPEK